MGISPTYAIALSNVTILGGSMANTYLYMQKSHPVRERSLIGVKRMHRVYRVVLTLCVLSDFNFAVLMEPPTMAGAMIGTIINKNSPGATRANSVSRVSLSL